MAITVSENQGVKTVRKELRSQLKKYDIVDDAVEGEEQVKFRREKYLPHPDYVAASSRDPADIQRYKDYLTRAVFYPVTGRTLEGLVGQIFFRPPTHNLIGDLEAVAENISGTGLTIEQQSKRVTQNVTKHGRAGLLVDYPRTQGGASVAEKENGLRTFVREYESRDVINWVYETVGDERKLVLLVLREQTETIKNEFENDITESYRVCRLRDNVYTQQFYTKTSGGFMPQEEIVPSKANGQAFNEIPFTFVGAENNDHTIDEPPLYAIANLNIAHYRNSADYEESAFLVGQPSLAVIGLDDDWIKSHYPDGIRVGARAALPLPEGGDARFVQADPNTIAFEAMTHKEKQMVAIGAKLVENREVEATATEVGINRVSETSVLATIAQNVSAAYVACLSWASEFESNAQTDFEFALNTDFEISKMTTEERTTLMAEWQADAISHSEYRRALRKDGRDLDEDETALKDIKDFNSMLVEQAQENMLPGQNPDEDVIEDE